jgi:hypothetical protein
MDMNMETQMIDLNLLGEQEIQAFVDYESRHKILFPMPETRTVKLMKQMGWQFSFLLVQSLFAVLLAALRTADMFFLSASSSNQILAFVEAFAAIFAVEGGIVLYAAVRAEVSRRINTKILIAGELIGIIISIFAGLGQSLSGFQVGYTDTFRLARAVALGLGASILCAVSGSVLGQQLAKFGTLRDEAVKENEYKLHEWRQALRDSWKRSDELKYLHSGIKAAVKTVRPNVRANEKTNTPTVHRNQTRDEIVEYLEKNATDEFTPGPSQIARDLGVSKSYAHEVITDWKTPDYSEALLPEETLRKLGVLPELVEEII